MLKDQKIMEKYSCALELYCNLTPAELICHLLFSGRAYLRKDNSCKNWSKEKRKEEEKEEKEKEEKEEKKRKEDKKLTVISIEIWEKL